LCRRPRGDVRRANTRPFVWSLSDQFVLDGGIFFPLCFRPKVTPPPSPAAVVVTSGDPPLRAYRERLRLFLFRLVSPIFPVHRTCTSLLRSCAVVLVRRGGRSLASRCQVFFCLFFSIRLGAFPSLPCFPALFFLSEYISFHFPLTPFFFFFRRSFYLLSSVNRFTRYRSNPIPLGRHPCSSGFSADSSPSSRPFFPTGGSPLDGVPVRATRPPFSQTPRITLFSHIPRLTLSLSAYLFFFVAGVSPRNVGPFRLAGLCSLSTTFEFNFPFFPPPPPLLWT